MIKASNMQWPIIHAGNFAIQACRIDFVHRIYFWFSFYCACPSFKHTLMYLYIQWDAPLFKSKSMYSPPPPQPHPTPWPSKSFIPLTCIVSLHNICKREAGSRCVCGGGGQGVIYVLTPSPHNPTPPLDPANPLYHWSVLSIYTIYVSGKLGQGVCVCVGGGALFSKPCLFTQYM